MSGTGGYNAVPYLTPIQFNKQYGITLPTNWTLNPNPSTISGSANGGREVPDVSADADPYSGYILYAPSSAGQDGIASPIQPGWGGTSFVAPELNGTAAVIDSALGRRTGFWNPSIYKFAQTANSPFTPLDASGTSNDNLYYTGTPGTLYNPGAGSRNPEPDPARGGFRRSRLVRQSNHT